jgi:hypothetical protein
MYTIEHLEELTSPPALIVRIGSIQSVKLFSVSNFFVNPNPADCSLRFGENWNDLGRYKNNNACKINYLQAFDLKLILESPTLKLWRLKADRTGPVHIFIISIFTNSSTWSFSSA